MPIPNHLNKMELEALLQSYNSYIQEANEQDKYSDGWRPVCIDEYYDNEWLEIYRDMWIDALEGDKELDILNQKIWGSDIDA